jgi:hypothetical protein
LRFPGPAAEQKKGDPEGAALFLVSDNGSDDFRTLARSYIMPPPESPTGLSAPLMMGGFMISKRWRVLTSCRHLKARSGFQHL